jgi:hypothetical protein
LEDFKNKFQFKEVNLLNFNQFTKIEGNNNNIKPITRLQNLNLELKILSKILTKLEINANNSKFDLMILNLNSIRNEIINVEEDGGKIITEIYIMYNKIKEKENEIIKMITNYFNQNEKIKSPINNII